MNNFIRYAMSHENVWFATISEVGTGAACSALAMRLCHGPLAPSYLPAHQPPWWCSSRAASPPPPTLLPPARLLPPPHAPPLPLPPAQVLEWQKNPVDAWTYKKARAKQGCDPPTDMWFPSGEFCKSVQCVNGEPGHAPGHLP